MRNEARRLGTNVGSGVQNGPNWGVGLFWDGGGS